MQKDRTTITFQGSPLADYLSHQPTGPPQRKPQVNRPAATLTSSSLSTVNNGLATRIDSLQAEVDIDASGSKWLLKKKIEGSKVKHYRTFSKNRTAILLRCIIVQPLTV